MKEFLNPKATITPGIAGTLVMFLANGLHQAFPEIAFRYLALALSFLLAFFLLGRGAARLTDRIGYGVINALVIFVVGVGASNIGANLTQAQASSPPAVVGGLSWHGFDGLASTAQAQQPAEPAAPAAPLSAEDRQRLEAELQRLREEEERLRRRIEAAETDRPPDSAAAPDQEQVQPQQQPRFFQTW